MYTRKFNIRSGRFLAGFILMVLLTALATSGAQACHRGKPHGKDAPPTCDPPQPPGYPDVMANWGEDLASSGLYEEIDRLCIPTQTTEENVSGAFDCELNHVAVMHQFDYMTSTAIHRRGDDWRCEPTLSGGWLHPDDEYSFTWSGDCTVEPGCDITIVNRYSNPGFIGGTVDRMTLEAFAFGVVSAQSNPFGEAQGVEVDVIHYTMFSSKGKNKVLAKCELIPHPDWPVVLHTTPVVE